MPPRTRVLHVFGRMMHGGAELRTLDIMRNLDRRRFELHFCALSGLPGDLDSEIVELGGVVHLCRLGPLFPLRFRALLRRGGYDALHSHVLLFSGFLLGMGRSHGIPIRIAQFRSTTDGHPDTQRRRLQRRWMRRLVHRNATSILANSEAVMEAVWGTDWPSDARCRVIPNGLDVSRFPISVDAQSLRADLGISEDAPLFLHVGRFDRAKNHLRVASIFAQIARSLPGARMLFLGRGNNVVEAQVRERLGEAGLEERATFCGVRSDVPRFVLAADLVLFPSLWEGMPGAVLEACAAGTPVLASKIPPHAELAVTFPNVFTLDLDRTDEDWAAEALRLVRDKEARRPPAEALRFFRSSPYSIERCVEQHVRAWTGA